MKKKRTIPRRVLSALILLVVFFFIHAVKALHTHETSNACSDSKSISQLEKSSHCTICDYQFSKDGDVSISFSIGVTKPFYPTHFIFYQSRTTSSIGLSYADRGPPAAFA